MRKMFVIKKLHTPALLLCLMLGVFSRALRAQAEGLRGAVTSRESGTALPFAVVSVEALNLEGLSNAQGKFFFPHVAAGTHRLTVRALGFSPVELEVEVVAGIVKDVAIQMERIATRIAPMRVLADWACSRPGRPENADDLELTRVFEQVEQSAIRMRLMSRQYPYRVVMERRAVAHRADGSDSVTHVDTIRFAGATAALYKPGSVIRKVGLGSNASHYLQVPTLLEFGDATFQKNHCFLLRGVETSDEGSLIRVDFKAAEKLHDPDVEGSVFLDTATYRLRKTEIRLTRIPPGMRDVNGVTASTYFADLFPGLPAISGVHATSEFRKGSSTSGVVSMVEQQMLVGVQFLKTKPDALSSVPPL